MARLLRRTGFGTTGDAVDAALVTGSAAYVNSVVSANPATDPGVVATPVPSFAAVAPVGKAASKSERTAHGHDLSQQLLSLTTWWLRRMVSVHDPAVEKLTFCWHNHFATAATKVRHASWLAAQNSTLRELGRGDFRPLALAMLTDAAMLDWLDGEKNTAAAPNENLSREFMELFALGHGGGYTETDVREGARALTGWRIRTDGSTELNARAHDNGSKTFLGVTGDLDQVGYCDAVLAQPASPRYVAARWWGQLGSNLAASEDLVDRLVAAYGPQRSMAALFTAILTAPEFTAAHETSVISPVEWLIGAVRTLRVPIATDAAAKNLVVVLRGLGQVPFYPPSVGGWPSGQAWLSTASADLRFQAASSLVRAGNIDVVSNAAPSSRLDVAAHFLGVATWSSASAGALQNVASNPAQLVAVALNTPEYLTA